MMSAYTHELSIVKSLIQSNRYQEAYQLLMQIEHPTAQKWLAKLELMNQDDLEDTMAARPIDVAAMEEMSAFSAARENYNSGRVKQYSCARQFYLSVGLLFLGWVPGLLAFTYFAIRARSTPYAPYARALRVGARRLWQLTAALSVLAVVIVVSIIRF